VASGSTLRRIDRNTGSVELLSHDLDNQNSILDEQITGIHGNQSGVIWLTYLNEGISRINIRTQNFRSYRFRSDQSQGLGGNTVRSVFKDPSGVIWVGLYNDGLDRIETGSGKITHYQFNPEDDRSICSNYISSLFLDRYDRLWVGSHDNGLCVADRANSGNLRFTRTDFLNHNEEIYHIAGDSLGRIWIGTRNGLGMYDWGSRQFQWILEKHNVQSFLFDKESVWISSWDYGLCRLDFEPEEFSSLHPSYDTVTSILGRPKDGREFNTPAGQTETRGLRNCISIYRDQQSKIWVGTYDRGLARAEPGPGGMTYTLYDVVAGAPGNSIYGVTGDEEGNIWISTENGLGKFDPVSEQFENYFREDGLLSDYFMWKSYFKASDGELYFGSVDGLTHFYPREIQSDHSSHKVLISELRIQDRVVECGDTVNGDIILDRHISYTDYLALNSRNSQNFSISFYAPGLVNHQIIKYSYMLSGFDKNWIRDGKGNRMATYTNLSPGNYYFRVRATESDLSWDGTYTEIALSIGPPWWKTKVAYAVYIVFIVGLVFVITHSLIRFIGLKQELIYNEKLHQSKLMFFTNISHEFKTPLSLIKAPLNDILNEKELSPRNRKNLQVARHNADNLLKLVNELLEFRRTDTGISKLRAERLELMGFVREIVEEFECVSEQKKVDFYVDIPMEPLHVWVDREKFRKIINNLLENALNYTSEEGLVTLSMVRNPLDFKFKPDYHTLQLNNINKNLQYIGILVSDTGVGISRESLPKIFERFYQIEAERASHHIGSGIGLALVKNLILMHQGEIRVGSERTVGTDILVMLPMGDQHLTPEEKVIPQTWVSGTHPFMEEKEKSLKQDPSVTERNEGRNNRPRILVVEDHKELRDYLMEHLSEDYSVEGVPHGRAALEYMKQSRPDLVIADWIMPVMDGEELIRQIRADERLSAVPVILLTGKSEVHERQAGLELGADQIITKPFSIQLLTSQVHRIIENNQIRMRKYGRYSAENIQDARNSQDAAFLELLEKAVLKHLRDISLNASVIAGELGISRTVLYEKLKSVTGQTIGEFIQRVRLQQAIRLMLYENRPLSEIHVMVGINSTSYLIRLFRKYYHTTPREYIRTFLKTSSN
jgi:signal transduction histidine kinase/DNA-binding response OmpR family regulator/streptogramin lyase